MYILTISVVNVIINRLFFRHQRKGSTVANYTYQLAYEDVDHFLAEIGPGSFRRGNRIPVKLSDNTDYVFTYMGNQGDSIIHGVSALNGRMVILDLEQMTLSEQAEP
jgi:hypothetical protein